MTSTLRTVAEAMVAPGRGILAADESSGTANARFSKLGIPQTAELRRQYRELLFTSADLGRWISGAILYDETLRQADTQGTPLADVSDTTIIADVGPEVISGSTRMKASTSQKMILNMITTGAMTRLGYVYENWMVNVHMKNAKLVERGIRVLMKVCNIDRDAAIRTIKSAGKSIPIALVMLKANVDKMEAVRRLTKSDGNVRLAIDDSRLEL